MLRLWRAVALPVLLGFAILGTYLYFYLGAHKEVTVFLSEEPARRVIFRVHRGPYHEINSVISSVEQWAKSRQIDCTESFGQYFDDPKQVEEARLTSHGGCIVPSTTPVEGLPAEYQQEEWASGSFLRAEFSGSPAIGPWRVYPRLKAFLNEKNIRPRDNSTIEIYRMLSDGGMRTTYLVPLAKPSQ